MARFKANDKSFQTVNGILWKSAIYILKFASKLVHKNFISEASTGPILMIYPSFWSL